MPIYGLDENLIFPSVEGAEDGIVAIGGDLSKERLVLAYQEGIFPWFSEDDPIIWWAPDPRFILYPSRLKISKSMKSILNKKVFSVTFDTCFSDVIKQCQQIKRKDQEDTWITEGMLDAYCSLHEDGIAHSVEVWNEERQLVGGLYGVSLGKCFFGESMFSKESNASKTGFITLVQKLKELNFQLIDCQIHTNHLESLGAEEISRNDFMKLLKVGIGFETLQGDWKELLK
ncbi:MAG: leucyl/phenylalanyl-tRNA--protein transferase [Cytophagales bacterium]|nr:leucyl/phenylalanyl-tRNA--protein transferase [Cytophagales bacterium]